MKKKNFFKAILRTATLFMLFIAFLNMINLLYIRLGIEETIGNTIFWTMASFLAALKIALIEEDI